MPWDESPRATDNCWADSGEDFGSQAAALEAKGVAERFSFDKAALVAKAMHNLVELVSTS